MRKSAFTLCLLLTSCGRYADFTLPLLPRTNAEPRITILQDPVLTPGTWDSSDVLNPSVVERNGRLYNFYSGFDGKTWHTGLAESTDGIHWTKHDKPVLSPSPQTWESNYIAANGTALVVNNEFWYWYQTGQHDAPQIALARSKDGVTWIKEPGPVLPHGPRGSFDESATADPYALQLNGTFYLYYLGQNRAAQQRLGLARSSDGIHWEKLRSNPVLDLPAPASKAFDANGLGEPAVFVWKNSYWLLWTGRDSNEHRALRLASSPDGVHWDPQGEIIRGTQPWNSTVVCDPTVLLRNGTPTIWFGGGNQPSPDEHLNGSIGMATIQ